LAGRHFAPARQAGSRAWTIPFIQALRASVGSTEAAKDVVARFGRIDRRIREVTSRRDVLCTLVTIDP
jgi:hypothetical protein